MTKLLGIVKNDKPLGYQLTVSRFDQCRSELARECQIFPLRQKIHTADLHKDNYTRGVKNMPYVAIRF
jgi:hypothetical protein